MMFSLNPRHFFYALVLLALAACSRSNDATRENFTRAMNSYLQVRGDLCLGKSEWPIDVSAGDIERGARDAVQMPVLERLGLVSSSRATVETTTDEASVSTVVTRYALTDAGRKYFLKREPRRGEAKSLARADFCPVKLSLDQIVEWKTVRNASGGQDALVTYTYVADAAPWTEDAAVAKVFPIVARVTAGARSAQLQEAFQLTDSGWVAADL